MMKIISLNIGKPNEITWKGKRSVSGIYKYPTEKKVFVSPTNIEGDGQGNLKVHGGIDKAIYVYPFEHYEYWKKSFPDIDFSEGIFGENLTTAGLDEFGTNIGDKFKIGEIIVEVSEPRFPCVTLAARLGTTDIIKPFLHSYKSGFYLRVLKEGLIQVGDSITIHEKSDDEFTVADFVKLYINRDDSELKEKALVNNAISDRWKEKFRK